MRFTEDTRGSATAEGVIIAPVLILLFAAVMWAYLRYGTGEVAIDTVRDSLWPQAVIGCRTEPRDEQLTAISRPYETATRRQVPTLAGYYDDVRVDMITAENTRTAERPAPLGRADDQLSYAAQTSCNTTPVDYGDELELAIDRTFCRAVPYCDDDCNCDEPPEAGFAR